ncbi:MAG: hypothetical protein QXJ06_05220 [Candidatus Aenigmatarchaeota archaeon]
MTKGNQPLDLTFIINEPGKTLKDRFEQLIKDCKFFDCLVGYYYLIGLHNIHKSFFENRRIQDFCSDSSKDFNKMEAKNE